MLLGNIGVFQVLFLQVLIFQVLGLRSWVLGLRFLDTRLLLMEIANNLRTMIKRNGESGLP